MGIKQVSASVENIMGKGEIARYEQFLLFPYSFQKLSVVDASKWVLMDKTVQDWPTLSSVSVFSVFDSSFDSSLFSLSLSSSASLA